MALKIDYGQNPTDDKKIALVTGSTDGIGLATAKELYLKGFYVILHGRSMKRLERAKKELLALKSNRLKSEQKGRGVSDERGKDIDMIKADFSSFDEIRLMIEALHRRYDKLDVLINNAAILPLHLERTKDGNEMQFQVNYLAMFLLTLGVLDLLAKSDWARIINVSSMIHAHSLDFDNLNSEKGYDPGDVYSATKLEVVLFTYALNRRSKENGLRISVNCLHPGVISTKLLHTLWGGGAPPSEGAKTSVFLATNPEIGSISGKYFMNKHEARSSAISYDIEIQEKLWQISERLTGISFDDIAAKIRGGD